MAYDQTVALILMGVVYLLFKFGESIETSEEWQQAIKLFVNFMGLFILLGGMGFAVQLLRTTAGVDAGLIDIGSILFIGLMFTVVPLLLIFLVMFIKKLLEFFDSLRSPKF